MKIRTFASVALVVVLAGLLFLAIWGALAWQEINERIDGISELKAHQQRIHQMSAAIDYSTLVRLDDTVVAALADDANRLRALIADIDHRQARLAASHLEEIALMGEFLLSSLPAEPMSENPQQQADRLLTLSRQIRIHHAGAREALEALLNQRNAGMLDALYGAVQRLLTITILFAALVLLTALVINRRLVHPLRAIDAGLKAMSQGNLDARIQLDRNDEMGDLARSFNRSADQRVEHEQQLEESRSRFEQIAESIGETFWLAEPDNSRIHYLSPAYESMWGHDRQRVYRDARQWTNAIHEVDRPHVLKALELHPEGRYEAEYRVVHPDGSIRWIHDRSFPVRDDQGSIIRIAGVARDITEMKQHQLQLNERIKELRCLFQVLELTTSGELTPGEVAERIVELLPESVQFEAEATARIDYHDQTFLAGQWQNPVATIHSDIRLGEEVVGRIMVGYRSRPVDVQPGDALFLPEEQALVNGIALHFNRMLEQRRLNRSLAHSERLKAVGELTGGMAHDFNNLLTVIIGNAEMLHEQLGQEQHPAAGLADMISTAGERGAELTRRMLAFARRQELEPEVIDINALIGSMKPLLKRSLGEEIELKVEADGDPVSALVDPVQIESAVLNLCLNARDAMPNGGRLTVEISVVDLDPAYAAGFDEVVPGRYVLLAVSDTGCGVAPEHIERVFEPFFTTKEHGTGLGLSMAYGLVKQLRGHIRIYSEPGQGTTVRMYLPAAGNQDTKRLHAGDEPLDVHGSETILLVEDNDLVRDYAREQLRGLGYEVIEAANGPDALTIVRQRDDIDLLFTDVVMPGGMNGKQLVDEVLAIHPHIKVLYTSGYTQNAIVHHGRLDAGVELLAKPYHRHELARRIREILDHPADANHRGNTENE